MENGTTNVLVAGVGGQGVILASDIMSEVFMEAGYDVKKSEVHGMAMRGGIVTSHFRFGKKVYSPLIKEGEVDILFAFDKLEGLRWINHLKRDGKIIMNDHRVNPCSQFGREGIPQKYSEENRLQIQGILPGEGNRPATGPPPYPIAADSLGAKRTLVRTCTGSRVPLLV